MRFTDIFIKRPVLAMSLSLLILVLGAYSLTQLQLRQYPEMQNTVITITTMYPGASSDLVQGFVTQPIQQAVASANGVEYIESQSQTGQSVITVNVRLNFDPNAALSEVLFKVQSVRYQLPKEVYDPAIVKWTGDQTSAMYLVFYSDKLSAEQISDYLNRAVRPKLSTVAGVADPKILGEQAFSMRIWLDPRRMAALSVTAEDVSNALLSNNVQASPGTIQGYFDIYKIDAKTDLNKAEDFAAIIVRAQQDAVVRLGDVAQVIMESKSRDVRVQLSGQPAVFIGVDLTPNANPLTVVDDLRKILPEVESNLPSGLKMQIAYDSTVFIRASIDGVVETLWEAVIIVMVVVTLFLGSLRATVIPLVAIPLSLVGVAIVMSALGFSLNLLTLLAMVLAIGLVVDDAIVVVENVHRHIEEGRQPIEAALVGMREIAVPIITMTLTLAAVYTPIALVSGLTGALFREFALALAGSVIVSGIIALTLSPMMASRILKHRERPGAFERGVEIVLGGLTRAYSAVLGRIIRWRVMVVGFALAVLAIIVWLVPKIPSELSPVEDQGFLMVMQTGPSNANADYLAHYGRLVSDIMQGYPETALQFTIAGYPQANTSFGIDALKPWDERSASASEISNRLTMQLFSLPGLKSAAFVPPALPGSGSGFPVQYVISTTDGYPALASIMDRFVASAAQSGVFSYIDSDLKYEAPTVTVTPNRDKAGAYGVSMLAIANVLSTLVNNAYVNRMNIDGRSYEVIPQVMRIDRLQPDSLNHYYVRTTNGVSVPLSNLVDIGDAVEPVSRNQFNQLNSATFQAALMPGVTQGQALAKLDEIAREVLPQGYGTDHKGESRQYVQEGSSIVLIFALAIVIIYLVLAMQFESFRDPLVILISVPLATLGAILPLALGHATLNIYTEIGLVTLIGLISKHGILICEVAKERQMAGYSRFDAVMEAARLRLRPILMTTAAMIAGLIPLLHASGAGSESRQAIGMVIVFGLAVGTLFTLFVLPTLYTFLASDHRARAKREEAMAGF